MPIAGRGLWLRSACADGREGWSGGDRRGHREQLGGAGRARAQAEGLRARFEEADAEALPFEDASFDVVASLIGAMFAPRPDLVAKELLRVCDPGGTIAMANWTPQGFVGQMFKTVSKFIAPSGMPSPVLWGDETTVRERLGKGLSDLQPDQAALYVQLSLPSFGGRGVFPTLLRTDQSGVCVP